MGDERSGHQPDLAEGNLKGRARAGSPSYKRGCLRYEGRRRGGILELLLLVHDQGRVWRHV